MQETNEKENKNPKSKLNMRQDLFTKAYTAIGQPTFGIASKSYIAAGFHSISPEMAASRLLAKPIIQDRIHELYAELVDIAKLTPEIVVANIRNIKERALALDKPDLVTALNATKLEGQMLSLFAERHVIQAEVVPTIPEEDSAAYRLAADVLKNELASPDSSEDGLPNNAVRETTIPVVSPAQLTTNDKQPVVEFEQLYEPEERIPASEVGRSPGRPRRSANEWS